MKALSRPLGTTALAVVVVACALSIPLGSASGDSAILHRGGGQDKIYFFARPSSPVALVGQHLPLPNPLVVRPSGFPLFEDGQWVLEKLHWSGWGSPVARARGLSSSSNDDPNAVEGKRIITWAKVRLSSPGTFHGHRVYRCIRVTVPRPAHYPPACLQRSHRYIGLIAPGSGEPVGVPGNSDGRLHLTGLHESGPQGVVPDRVVRRSWAASRIGRFPATAFPFSRSGIALAKRGGYVR